MSYHSKALYREEANMKGFCKDYGVGRGHTCFMTGTFRENIKDKKEAVYYWNILRTQLVKIFGIFRYICVWERQERGAWHFHIIFHCPKMGSVKRFKIVLKNILDCSDSKFGFIQVKWTKGNYKSVGNYMYKYLTKEHREKGLRYINYSRNFLRKCSSQFMFVYGGAGAWRASCRVLDSMFPDTFKFFYENAPFDNLLSAVNGVNGDVKTFFKGLKDMYIFYDKMKSNPFVSHDYKTQFFKQLSGYMNQSKLFYKSILQVV